MTGRTLEEIAALAAEATPGPWGVMGRTVGINPENPMTWSGLAMVTGYGRQSDANLQLIAALPDLLAIAQGQREEIARLKRLVKMALLEGVAICAHREDLTEPWENGERAWNGSKASEEVNMAIGTKK